MARGCRYKVEVAALALLGLMGLLFLLHGDGGPSSGGVSGDTGGPFALSPAAAPDTPPPPPPPAPAATPAPCQENRTAAALPGFAELPGHIQDFLRFRHCRDFPMLLDQPEKCSGGDVFLLLAIKSWPGHYERREMIRRTWGQERAVAGLPVRRVFLLGVAAGEGGAAAALEARRLDRLLRLEAAEHGDVLQWSFRDTFFNLTLKQSLFHAWLESRCPGARFLLNGDDDIFAHTDNLVRYLRGLPGAGRQHLFVGHLIAHVGPIRERWSKYYVPEQVTSATAYPPYCGGGGLLMSGYTAGAIHRASRGLPLFPIDDVYLGMCLERAGLAPASHAGVRMVGLRLPSATLDPFDPCYFRELLLVHRFTPYEMLLMWRALRRPGLVCGRHLEFYPRL